MLVQLALGVAVGYGPPPTRRVALRLSAAEPAPWYFSMKDLLETWESAGGTREAAYDRVKIVNLREMVRLLQAKTPTPKPGLFLAGMANLEAVGRK